MRFVLRPYRVSSGVSALAKKSAVTACYACFRPCAVAAKAGRSTAADNPDSRTAPTAATASSVLRITGAGSKRAKVRRGLDRRCYGAARVWQDAGGRR